MISQVEPKNIKYIGKESTKVIARVRKWGRCWFKGTTLLLCRMKMFRDPTYNVIVIVNSTVNSNS